MNDEERAIIDFALLWQPYGGPKSEDILVTFGMDPQRFRSRLHAILTAQGTSVDRPYRQLARAQLCTYLSSTGAELLEIGSGRGEPPGSRSALPTERKAVSDRA